MHVETMEDIADLRHQEIKVEDMSRCPRTCRCRVKPLLFPVMVDGKSRLFAAAAPTTFKTSQGNI